MGDVTINREERDVVWFFAAMAMEASAQCLDDSNKFDFRSREEARNIAELADLFDTIGWERSAPAEESFTLLPSHRGWLEHCEEQARDHVEDVLRCLKRGLPEPIRDKLTPAQIEEDRTMMRATLEGDQERLARLQRVLARFEPETVGVA